MSIAYLFTIIVLEGFVTISVQILAMRQLAPFVGNSVIVTSLIIGIFLLFLAIGYRRGGSYKDNFVATLKKNFTMAAILIGIGLSYNFTFGFFVLFEQFISKNILLNLSLYLILIIAPIVYILGQTIPITTNLFKQKKSIGEISGTALYVSTIGSFLGAVLTSIVLLNFLGVAWTVVINYAILLLLTLILIQTWQQEWLRIFILCAGFYIIFQVNVNYEKQHFVASNHYANYQVAPDYHYVSDLSENTQAHAFIINNSLSSILFADKKAAPYIEKVKQLLFKDLKLTDKTILTIGAGGFTLSDETTYGNHFTYLDIDPEIYSIALEHYIDSIKGEFIAQDARVYLKQTEKKYDVIFADAYSHRSSVPYYLLTQEYFTHIKETLAPNGIAVFNIIARPLMNDNYSKRVDNTIHSVFPNCMRIPTQLQDKNVNIIYICKQSIQESDTMIYTDNLNRSTLDFFRNMRSTNQ